MEGTQRLTLLPYSAVAEAESITLSRAIGALAEQRERVLGLHIRGRLSAAEVDGELDRIEGARADIERRIAALEPDQAPLPAIEPLLHQLRDRLDAGLTDEERGEIIRLLVHIVVHTEAGEDGKPHARAVVSYRFPAAVLQTSTDIREGLKYTTVRRVIELPSRRQAVA